MTLGIASRVEQICLRRRRRLQSWLLTQTGRVTLYAAVYFATILLLFTGLSYFFPGPDLPHGLRSVALPLFIVAVAALLLLATALAVRRRPRVDIINMPRTESPTYWQRNGSTWVIGMVTGILSVGAGILIGKL
jgi:hypothetical protein